ncbi:MAG: hypothetical protein ACM3PY_20200 [Omnitrophica WOR_2 bacterium]
MVKLEENVFCDNCGVEITWSPVVEGNRHYCCQDCKDGLTCDCGQRMELDDDRRETPILPI